MRILISILLMFFIFSNLFVLGEPMKKTIMIDLDGVLDNYTHYIDEIPEIRKGAKDFVKKLSKDYELILFTTRPSKQAVEWLQENKIDTYFKDVTNVKSPAYVYIDDRAVKFEGDYNKTLDEIAKFKVHWKN